MNKLILQYNHMWQKNCTYKGVLSVFWNDLLSYPILKFVTYIEAAQYYRYLLTTIFYYVYLDLYITVNVPSLTSVDNYKVRKTDCAPFCFLLFAPALVPSIIRIRNNRYHVQVGKLFCSQRNNVLRCEYGCYLQLTDYVINTNLIILWST